MRQLRAFSVLMTALALSAAPAPSTVGVTSTRSLLEAQASTTHAIPINTTADLASVARIDAAIAAAVIADR